MSRKKNSDLEESQDSLNIDLEESQKTKQADSEPSSESQDQDSQEKIQALEEKLATAQEAVLRTRADMENMRRRAQKDLENAHKYSLEKFARELLGVVDSLEKGLEASSGQEKVAKAIHEGIELTYKLLLSTLEKFSICVIDPLDKPFDPAQHEALAMQYSDKPVNTVIQVVQKGFTQHDRVLRHAKVIVSKGMGEFDE